MILDDPFRWDNPFNIDTPASPSRAHGLRFAAVREYTDGASRPLPPACARVGRRASGTPGILAVHAAC
jgi:hypothetical protein